VEILENDALMSRADSVNASLRVLRTIGRKAIEHDEASSSVAEKVLRRVIRLFSNDNIRDNADVPSALLHLLEQNMRDGPCGIYKQPLKALTEIIADEAVPSDFLQAVALSSDPSLAQSIYALLQKVLRKAALTSMNSDLSKSRMLLRTARQNVSQSLQLKSVANENERRALEASNIWSRMAEGTLTIDK
jgi:hypothetical protein